ncbi:MAG: ABC transporter ATP-binding protein [Candidatus Bathyarchaeia archaeon]
MNEELLKLEDVSVFYGDFCAVRNINLSVQNGEIVSLIGANGAGKTTILNAIMGLVHPAEGAIIFDNKRIDKLDASQIVSLGISLVPEGRRIFPMLTVYENLIAGAYISRARNQKEQMLKKVYDLFPILKERNKQLAGTLSGGEQQMLAIGRALMSNPKLLLLDEISLGLSPIVTLKLYDAIKKINSEGTTVLVVEQNIRQSLKVSHRAYILKSGEIVLSGKSKDLKDEEEIKSAYFGV